MCAAKRGKDNSHCGRLGDDGQPVILLINILRLFNVPQDLWTTTE